MRSVLLRIFLSFWLMIVITIVAAAGLGFYYAERTRAAMQSFEVSDAMLEASEALRRDGRRGLTEWLESLPVMTSSAVYILDERGRDLLRRKLPASVSIAVRRFSARRKAPQRDFGNLRPARPFNQLVGPDGHVYTFFMLPPQGIVARWFSNQGLRGLALLALLASIGVSFFVARAITRPVRRLRESATAIAHGELATRVGEGVSRRRDEIGLLAQDFDRMASELQRASRQQTELTRNVSHELRSPLARLRVALELARRKAGELPELDKIDEETERLDTLIGQILEFSRLDAEAPDERSRFDLVDLLHSVVEDVRFEVGDELAVHFEADGKLEVTAYAGAMRAGIENVLRNAALHGRAGSTISVSASRDGDEAVIVVQDDGGGVAEHELAHLFEPFYRAGDSRAEAARCGSGLGLAIAARALARNDGTIEAVNHAGGLRVTIRLPQKRT
jgi:two-component system sensor histidine kinase CpxA